MSPTNVAAQVELGIRRADGSTVPFAARVGVPAPSDGHWAREVRIEDGDGVRVRRICGVDSWQALTLALKYVRVNLECDTSTKAAFGNCTMTLRRGVPAPRRAATNPPMHRTGPAV